MQHVRVKPMMPPGHVRTPHYLRGKIGVIERSLGAFPNPEDLAYGHAAPALPLYRVRFRLGDIWGEDTPHPDDTLDAEIYDHWLEPADAP
ncbi:SH3-like domain-containing protein [Pseudooctadecabacter sp.]|uniref:SH3-like domain-containing protein n=1 Tax=Pseudooctadecabacter sp. TaxID=1966338 RepID=UPI0025D38A34|nr:SH3-like domain-containing protein [Pseudooctadecabacter sp.]